MSSHDAAARRLIVRDGTSQDRRRLAPLQDGYFALAEMPFADLLAMARGHAALVTFYQGDNRPDGDWLAYFSADETFVLARMLAARLPPHHARFEQWWNACRERRDDRPRAWDAEAGELPMAPLAELLDGWVAALANAPGAVGRKLHALLAGVIASLCDERTGFAALLPAAGATLGPIWRAPPGAHAALRPSELRSSYHSYVKAIEMVQQEARRQLPASLVSGEHEPGAALLIAFIRMAQRLDTRLNRFTGRHIDFYYDRVLRAGRLAAVPDHAYLVAAPAAAGAKVEIPAGAAFIAKRDGQELAYFCDDGLVVSDARVQALHTLYFHRDPHVSPETDMDRGGALPAALAWPSSAWTRDIAPPPGQPAPPPAGQPPLPLLGAPRNGAPAAPARDARLGFAIASNVLLMREGRRRITLELHFTSGKLKTRLDRLEKVMRGRQPQAGPDAAGGGEGAARPAPNGVVDQIEQEATMLRILGGLFKIELTGPAGWIAVPWYYPSTPDTRERYGSAGFTLSLQCELPLEAPPVVAYSPALHGENLATGVPVMRLLLNPDSYVYPYGLLRDLGVGAATVTVEVSGYRQLSLNNQLGQLDPASPFQPFGPLPVVGSYLIVGSGEAAAKDLTRFHLDLEWGELPELAGGFAEYYRDYAAPPSTDEYLARVEALTDGVWGPDDSRAPQLRLFADDYRRSASRRLLKRTRLDCDSVLGRLHPLDPAQATGAPYSTAARDGYFKFTLAGPRFAFGHREYPQALAHAMKRSLRNKDGRFMAGVPEAPYTPLVSAITAGYTARAGIALHHGGGAPAGGLNNALLHLHPHGWEAVDVASARGPTLIPSYAQLGYLHIGLSASDFDTALTLFFHLQNDALPDAPPAAEWSYLSGNKWQPLPLNNVLSDSTGNFMTSGVVTLRVPSDIGLEHTVMPAGLYWLRIGAAGKLGGFCSLYSVHTQGFCVRRAVADMQASSLLTLPAGSIGHSRALIPGLGKVSQIIASRGGRLVEDRAQRHTRIAERLRHKGRAVTPADYESLILERFPEIYKVKCFPNLCMDGADPQQWLSPGRVLIVVLPPLPPDAPPHGMPQLNGLLVAQVKAFVQTLAPPAAVVDVRHPVYEQIQVRCTVRLKPGLAGGRYITRLNDDLARFLSPWDPRHGRVHFGWSLREHDVESFIIGLDYIADVGACSLLRVAPAAGGGYSLTDTAHNGVTQVSWKYPWSVAVAIDKHLIDVSDSKGPARPANLHTLDIGSTFIISPEANDGTAKS
ncbi:Baseplate J-like protein [Duganella sp. CF517]|uniref:baseplate J/gp47 family protein n=1 Tax=Duganella sp. CF517 TaxID=1881038 RepID=UPI0008CE61BC|nr:baseplate J/gp47 family protein [Duganella sp. CF517]SEN77346.1 Baseplate J-like protein [Duganella sp. CF517]